MNIISIQTALYSTHLYTIDYKTPHVSVSTYLPATYHMTHRANIFGWFEEQTTCNLQTCLKMQCINVIVMMLPDKELQI